MAGVAAGVGTEAAGAAGVGVGLEAAGIGVDFPFRGVLVEYLLRGKKYLIRMFSSVDSDSESASSSFRMSRPKGSRQPLFSKSSLF
jgi:hypothetical protein